MEVTRDDHLTANQAAIGSSSSLFNRRTYGTTGLWNVFHQTSSNIRCRSMFSTSKVQDIRALLRILALFLHQFTRWSDVGAIRPLLTNIVRARGEEGTRFKEGDA